MTALYFLPWALALAVLGAWVIRQAHRIGYLEGRLAFHEDDEDDEPIDWRTNPLLAGPTSMSAFGHASRAELFGTGLPLPGEPPSPPPDPPLTAYSGMPPGWDGWNNYHGATGPAGVWAQRDRDRREGLR